ncbi:MAG: hypothetical protein K5641_03405 [Lachnospiraceae bacterium]|nr:hypothetical protein [Lachnospiraceae bacterium]
MKKAFLLIVTVMSFAWLTGFTSKTGWTIPDECPVMVREGDRVSFDNGNGLQVYEDNDSNIIFVGDSRAAFMMTDTGYKGVSWVTMPGRGADCLANEAIPAISSSLAGKTVIFVIGINDISPLRNSYERMQLMNWYTSYYKSLVASNPTTTFYVTSVTMRGNMITPQYIRFNNAIQFFNNRMSSIPGIHYIDTFGYLLGTGYGYLSPEDTLHYDVDTNRRLFQYIMKAVTGQDVELPPEPEPEPDKTADEAEKKVEMTLPEGPAEAVPTETVSIAPTTLIADVAEAVADPDDIDPEAAGGVDAEATNASTEHADSKSAGTETP